MKRPFGKYLIASMVLHGLTLLLVKVVPTPVAPPAPPDSTFLEWVEPLSPQDLAGLIVDQDEEGPATEEDVDTKFLGRRNQKVEQETKAQVTGKFHNAQEPAPASSSPSAPQTPPAAQTPPTEPLPAAPGLFPSQRHTFREMAQRQILDQQQADRQPSQTSDHLADIAASSQTHLNTREYIYYNYFSRIKERILQHWEPSIKKRITRLVHQGRFIASTGDRTTHLLITLNHQGQLVRVQVKSPSGLRDLDEEAIKAFEAAAPFPNPPTGLVETDGTIRLDWRFIIEA